MIVNSKLYFMFDSYQDRDKCVLYGLMLIILKALWSELLSGKVKNDKNR